MNLIITVLIVAAMLVTSEAWWRRKKNNDTEYSRKLVHIIIGTYAAFWPFYLSWADIRLLSLAFLIVVLISKKLSIFKSIHSVDRQSLGEIMFAVSIGLVTFITHNEYIYMAAILQMSLADGLAGLIGTKYGAKNKYKILKQTKSLYGTLAFLVTSLLIVVVFALSAPGQTWSASLILIALVATALENVSPYGLDNLTVPIVSAVILRSLT